MSIEESETETEAEMSETITVYVDELQVGDRFLWCDREVTILNIERAATYRRHGIPRSSRRFFVDLDDLHLHYFDHETVERALSDSRDTGEKPDA